MAVVVVIVVLVHVLVQAVHVHVQVVDGDLQNYLPMIGSFKGLGKDFFRKLTSEPRVDLKTGLHHFRNQNGNDETRIHLRIEEDGYGILVVNANRIFHLNPTAAYIAYLVLENIPPDKAINQITRRYKVKSKQAMEDFFRVKAQVGEIIQPGHACPICDLELETVAPFSKRPSAPYRMDLAITYRCNNDCSHCYNQLPRQSLELTTDTWKKIIDRLWTIGVPHIVFTGGEPTLRPDLPDLISHAEKNGQITGLNTNGRLLKHKSTIQKLVDAGLDHVQITLESHIPDVHDQIVNMPGAWQETVAGIRNALESRLFVMTNTTLLKNNSPDLSSTLDFLADLGVPTVGLNALIYSGRGKLVGTGLPETDLPPLLNVARDKLNASNQRLIWYTPTQYCQFDPVQLELGVKGCTAALYNMCIEPDGKVIPCQSYYQPLGDFLNCPWEKIWHHETAINLRERKGISVECKACAFVQECGGGCPLYSEVLQETGNIQKKHFEKAVQI